MAQFNFTLESEFIKELFLPSTYRDAMAKWMEQILNQLLVSSCTNKRSYQASYLRLYGVLVRKSRLEYMQRNIKICLSAALLH